MADLPTCRVPDNCSPRRPDETVDDFAVRWKAHRDAWRQQFLDDYYRPKETRLPSPNSEEDLDEEEMAHEVFLVERDIRIESGHPEPGDLPSPVVWPSVVYPPGKSLSEISEYVPGSYSPPLPSRRPEDEECDRIWETMLALNPESTPIRKRSSSPVEDGGLEAPAKRRRADINLEIPPAGPSTALSISSYKRKRVQDGDLDELQVAREQVQASPKRRKTDTRNRPALASVTSVGKRKRESGADEAYDNEVQAASRLGRGVLGAKRRRVNDEILANSADSRRDRNRITRTAREKATVTSSPRLTRARRRQLSGKDAQLFQLGQRGQIDLQGQAHETHETHEKAHDAQGRTTEAQGQAAEATADRSRPRRNATTKARPKTSNTTNVGAKTKAIISTKTRAKAKAEHNNTETGAGTKTRRGRPNRQVLTNSGERCSV